MNEASSCEIVKSGPVHRLPGAPGRAGGRWLRFSDLRSDAGFTLLEIMVVVVLIALTVTLVGLNLERDVDQVAHLEATRFAKLIQHAREESILSGKVYAVEVDPQQKSYLFLESSDEWVPVTNDDVLRQRRFPEYLAVRLDILAQGAPGPLLVVEATGEITPFQLVVTGERFLHVVKLDDGLNIQVDKVARDAT